MRAQVFFPSCWDGVNLDSPDHKSHMAYPIQAYNTGDCPDTHPVHLVSLFYEMVVSVGQFDYWGAGTWVFANGDTTGYGHHGDFTNGWDVDLLQEAIDTCTEAQGNVLDCPPLAAAIDQASADACVLETQIVDEPTGFSAPISVLPGCNPLWNGTGARPTCSGLPAVELVSVQTPLPTNWSEIGCIAEGASGRALTGASTTSANMTRATCAAFCAGKGFALAGVEYSDECYCDDELRNGASNATLLWNECTNRCAGNGMFLNFAFGLVRSYLWLRGRANDQLPFSERDLRRPDAPDAPRHLQRPSSTERACPSGWMVLGRLCF